MTTAHINAKSGDFAKTILLPGDPLRAKYIADNFLEDVKQVNSVRNMFGFTGMYKGKEISTMGTGMGIPSCSIYTKELITEYNVENLIRVGTAGAFADSGLELKDVVLASGACTDSNVNRLRFHNLDYAATASFSLLHKAYHIAKKAEIKTVVGNCFSSDYFYHPLADKTEEVIKKMKVLCIEMEAAGLYGTATEYGANALAILSISDIIGDKKQELTAEERQNSLNTMITLALDTAINF